MIVQLVIALFLPALLASPAVERDTNIIGGAPAKLGAYPHQVVFLYYSSVYCGGSIVTTSFVLTAAHCDMANLGAFKAVAGSLSYKKYSSGQVRSLSRFLRHSRYTQADRGFDIAIVKVSQNFVLNSNVQKVSININTAYPTGALIATGWGLTRVGDNNSVPEFLQEVVVSSVAYNTCWNNYGGLPANVMCAAASGKDTCQGDSGGPLGRVVNGQFVLYGITSFGYGCAVRNKPGVYTEVSKHYDWIKQSLATM